MLTSTKIDGKDLPLPYIRQFQYFSVALLFAITPIGAFLKHYFSAICIWLSLEIVFAYYVYMNFHPKHQTLDHLPELSLTDFYNIVEEVYDESVTPNKFDYLKGWFFGAEKDQISRMALLTWVVGVCFHKSLQEATPQQIQLAELFVNNLERITNHKFPLDYDGKYMRVALDYTQFVHRPIGFYVCTKFLHSAAQVVLLSWGFRISYQRHAITYFRKGDENLPTLAFFHGIGIGVAAYLRLIRTLLQNFSNYRVVLFEMPCIAMQISKTHCVPSAFAHIVKQECQSRGINDVIAIGHSYGTALIRWVDKYVPDVIRYRIFIEPVCFSLWTHDLIYNFLYRKPRTWMQYLIAFAASEPGLNLYFHRYCMWYENTYFSKQIPENCSIYLADKDDIVNSSSTFEYMSRFPCPTRKVKVLENAFHGAQVVFGDLTEIIQDVQFAADA